MTDLHPLLARLAEAGAYQPPSRPHAARNGTGRPAAPPGPGDPQAARYAAIALDREAAIVAGTAEGTRNDTLNKASFRIGQLVACGWLAESAAVDTLIDAGMACGLSYAESERTVTSGMDAGLRAPRDGVALHVPTPAAYVLPEPAIADQTALRGGQVSADSHDMGAPGTGSPELATETGAGTDAGTAQDTGEPATPQRPRQLIDGGVYIHSAAATVPAVWGDGDDVLWAAGEPLIVTGPTGVGKTTLGTMLVAGRLGLLPDALGYPVAAGHGTTLVLAMDRPRQIQRAMARLLRQYPEDVLNERLVVWQGPPPMDLARHPHLLHQLAALVGADTVVLDSLKDAAVKLSDEETGQGLSRAMNYCVTHGVEVLAYHHQKKNSNSSQGKPNTLSDVYGSHWITAGAGSVILLWGNAGDLVVELTHLKQPAAEVGPLSIGHDHTAGTSFLYDGLGQNDTLLDLLASGPQTAAGLASWVHGVDDRAAVAKVRRRLDRLVETGAVVLVAAPVSTGRGTDGRLRGREAARYALARSAGQPVDTHRRRTEAQSILKLDVSAGRTEERAPSALDLQADDTRDVHTEDTFTTNSQVGPKTHRSTPPARATESTPSPPPERGASGGHARVRTRVGDSTSWNSSMESHDVEVCASCFHETERLTAGPDGRRWCPRCAYLAKNSMPDDQEEN